MADQNLTENVVAVHCAESERVEARAVENGDSKSSVAMSIVTSGLEFKLDTVVDTNKEALELAAKLELALNLLALSESKLEAAMTKIGALQEKLRQLESER